jgi:hypothetical protein
VWKICCLAIVTLAVADAAAGFDEARYAALLSRHTQSVTDTAGTRVDYKTLQSSPDWRLLVASLAASDPTRLSSRHEKLAFWINAYNVLAIDVVLGCYPVASIKDCGSFFTSVWRRDAGRIGGRSVTLDEIEHEILRPMGDPRIHAAIVCASTSCPSLQREPFRAADVDAQLDAAMRRFLANPHKGLAIDRAAGRVRLSAIFDWFDEDFGGSKTVVERITPFAAEPDRAWLEQRGRKARISFFDYSWALNDTRLAP